MYIIPWSFYNMWISITIARGNSALWTICPLPSFTAYFENILMYWTIINHCLDIFTLWHFMGSSWNHISKRTFSYSNWIYIVETFSSANNPVKCCFSIHIFSKLNSVVGKVTHFLNFWSKQNIRIIFRVKQNPLSWVYEVRKINRPIYPMLL